MSDLKLNAYYYSFVPTGQREVDLILHAVARAGKAFHHTMQWGDDDMAGFYEHCEGASCEEWIQNAANKAAAELAALRAEKVSQCGHPSSLMLRSAETGKALYCELCDERKRRRDAESMEEHYKARAERAEAEAAG